MPARAVASASQAARDRAVDEILGHDHAVASEGAWANLQLGRILQPLGQELTYGLARRAHRQSELRRTLQFLEFRLASAWVWAYTAAGAILEVHAGDPALARTPFVATEQAAPTVGPTFRHWLLWTFHNCAKMILNLSAEFLEAAACCRIQNNATMPNIERNVIHRLGQQNYFLVERVRPT
jgi:hypothetical protein